MTDAKQTIRIETSYVILKRDYSDPESPRWLEFETVSGNPHPHVRRLAEKHGEGVFWAVPARSQKIEARIEQPKPVVRLGAPVPTVTGSVVNPPQTEPETLEDAAALTETAPEPEPAVA